MIILSEKAVKEIKRLTEQSPEAKDAVLRVKVVGGGCSGMSYKLDFAKGEPSEKDEIVEQDGVRVIVDSKSMLFLKGTTLEFSDGLNGKGFVFNNPNAKKSCGCGASFST